jgi:hypothetical protein
VEFFKGSVELAGEVALEAAPDLFGAESFCAAAFDVGPGFRVVSHSGDDSHVQGTVEPPVATAVESVADGVARGRGRRTAR